MATKSTSANADSGISTITNVRYAKDCCIVTLENGISGIIGSKDDYPLRDLLALKKDGAKVSYEFYKMQGEHKRYNMSWSI